MSGLMKMALRAASLAALASGASSLHCAHAQELSVSPPAVAQENVARFDIFAFEVKGNTVLSTVEVEDAVYGLMGPSRSAEDVEQARSALQAVYERRGYPTVVVSIPEQAVSGGVIRLDVAEQRVGQVTVSGATHTNRDKLLAQAPSLTSGSVPNFGDVQRDIASLNNRADRRVTPDLMPGAAPGTVDVELVVEESLPLHGTLELNNRGSASTSDLRGSVSLRHDDVFGRGDSASMSWQTAPERPGDGTVYSASYLARLPGSRLQVLGYAVHSDSDIATIGGVNVIGRGDLAGLRLIAQLEARGSLYQTITTGIDYKNFEENVVLGGDRDAVPLEYWPLMFQWRGDWLGEDRSGDLTVGAVWGIRHFGDDAFDFDKKRFKAQPNFFALRFDGSYTEKFENDLQLVGRLTGQWAGEPLVSNEEFGVGGVDSVRGYFESEILGDFGVATQLEVRSPSLAGLFGGFVDELRVHAFTDWGFTGIVEALPGQAKDDYLASAGIGVRLRALDYFNLNLDIAQPLIEGPDKATDAVIARFRLWGEF